MSRPEQNRLLDALSPEERRRLFPELEAVAMSTGDTIYAPATKIDYVYFPTTSIVALLHITENGASAEIALVGNEGLAGVSLFMGGETTSSWAVSYRALAKAFACRESASNRNFSKAAGCRTCCCGTPRPC